MNATFEEHSLILSFAESETLNIYLAMHTSNSIFVNAVLLESEFNSDPLIILLTPNPEQESK